MKDITLMHEHVYVDLSGVKNNLDCKFDDELNLIEEYKKLYDMGVRTILDLTNIGMGRNIEYTEKISKITKINIINATGCYKTPFIPKFVDDLSTDKLAEIFIKEIEDGIDGTNIKAKIIGEIGTSKNEMTEQEEKIFLASIIASKKTNVFISTHCTLGTFALEQLEFFKKHNMNMNKLIIGHVDLSGDKDYILKLLEYGTYIAFDTVGKNNYMPDEKRIMILKELQDLGYMDKIILSMDITRKTHLKNNGGLGYSYIIDKFIPDMEKNGITKESIEKMLVLNPKKILENKE